MQDVTNDNRVLSLVAQSGIRNTLVTLLDQLQRCQKSLNEFLEVGLLTVLHAPLCLTISQWNRHHPCQILLYVAKGFGRCTTLKVLFTLVVLCCGETIYGTPLHILAR